MHPKISAPTSPASLVLAWLVALGTVACGGPASPGPEATAAAPAADPVVVDALDATATDATESAAADEAAALAAREQELATQEADLALREKEQELARREAELAKREAAARKTTAPKTATTPRPAATTPTAAAPVQAAPAPTPVTVLADTPVSIRLNSGYSTKTAGVGETVNAELASDLVVDGRVVARAGAPVSGSVTEVISGSRKIGAVPSLTIDMTQLVVADGTTMPVSIRISQQGKSEKGRDTAKILGGTAAGAIIGHQVDDDKGRVIGGVLGGAAGAVAAHKTGTEVELPAGTVLPASVRTAFTYTGR